MRPPVAACPGARSLGAAGRVASDTLRGVGRSEVSADNVRMII